MMGGEAWRRFLGRSAFPIPAAEDTLRRVTCLKTWNGSSAIANF